jgi:small subunit ribosomal protein S8
MSVNDPISDMLTRIRNAGMARQSETTMPSTKVLVAIAKILQEEGYIADFRVIERVSKPGLRVYAGKDDIPRVKSGLGIAIVSTPQGVLTGYEARRRGIGGEVLCTVF